MFASAQQNGLGTKDTAVCQRKAGPESVAHSSVLEAGVGLQPSLSLSANQFHTLFNADNGSSVGSTLRTVAVTCKLLPTLNAHCLPWSVYPYL